MGGLKDLAQSERGLLTVAIILAASGLAIYGISPEMWDRWTNFVMIVFGTYVAGKTATSVAGIVKNPDMLRAGAATATTTPGPTPDTTTTAPSS